MSYLFDHLRTEEWQIKHSSLTKISNSPSFKECKEYACKDIASKTRLTIKDHSPIFEIPPGKEFHFIGRVDTSRNEDNPEAYYRDFSKKNFTAFSTINNKNISRYKGRIFFIYNILPEDIVHIFPMDSDSYGKAETEEELCALPSLWLSLEDLENLTNELGVYNQITCKTKRDGKFIKPIGVVSFNRVDTKIAEIAETFGIPCIVCHPNKNAIDYDRDLLYDVSKLHSISPKIEEKFDFTVDHMVYLD